ncbi:aminopeptidase [Rhodotorula toruloides]
MSSRGGRAALRHAVSWIDGPARRPFASTLPLTLPHLRHSSSTPQPLSHPHGHHATFPAHATTKAYGQPLPSTHPHLLAPGELTPGIAATEYEERRRKLMDKLDEGAVVVLSGGQIQYMTQNIFYRFRQRSNFWYLTGFEEPDSALIFEKDSSSRGYKMTLFCRPKDAYEELWNGARTGLDGVMEVFGADEACDSARFGHRLQQILSHNSRGPVYIDLPSHSLSTFSRTRRRTPSRPFLSYISLAGNSPGRDEVDEVLKALEKRDVRSAAKEVERLRLIKSEAEVKVMRKAADISADAHAKVMWFARPGIPESSLVAHFSYHTALSGSPRLAYVPVCASGAQALTIHYVENNRPVKEGEMVLIDAGCEWGGYASDITRTFPASGTFTTPQAHLYEAVLRVHRACTKRCTSSSSWTFEDLHRYSVDLTQTELRDLGFEMRAGELERVLYPHFVGHPIGVDLHDTRTYGRDERLREGMVVTVEPGITVPPVAHFPKHFHNLTVRIEDEVLVRKEDCVVLSVDAPKELVDVEACCQGFLEGVREEKGAAAGVDIA